MIIKEAPAAGLTRQEIASTVNEACQSLIAKAGRVLLLPPDITRMHARAGIITIMLYNLCKEAGVPCDIMPALGTHVPMTDAEIDQMFPGLPHDIFFVHDWRNEVADIGEIPAAFVDEISQGAVSYPIRAQVNRRLLDARYGAIFAIGQVVPHEVAGLSSYTKHTFIGCGGFDIINRSHFLGASVGAEHIMGRADTAVRKVLNYAHEHFAAHLPLTYIMTVIGATAAPDQVNGLYIGGDDAFHAAAQRACALNITLTDRPIRKAVVYLDPEEYRSTWLGNKAIYRTRMALAQDAQLLVLAPGIHHFGEDDENDRLIAKYGYCGRDKVLDLVKTQEDLQNNLSVAAHLIHGSSDGAFSITYAVDPANMPLAQIRSVGYQAADCRELLRVYDPKQLSTGFCTVQGEEIYFIANPALGLWSSTPIH